MDTAELRLGVLVEIEFGEKCPPHLGARALLCLAIKPSPIAVTGTHRDQLPREGEHIPPGFPAVTGLDRCRLRWSEYRIGVLWRDV